MRLVTTDGGSDTVSVRIANVCAKLFTDNSLTDGNAFAITGSDHFLPADVLSDPGTNEFTDDVETVSGTDAGTYSFPDAARTIIQTDAGANATTISFADP